MKRALSKSAQNGTYKKTRATTQKAKPNATQGLRKLFVDELKDIYWAEKALTKAIPKMIKKVANQDLVEVLTDHLKVTNLQITRIEEVFESIGEKATAVKCEAMAGLIKETEQIMEDNEKGVVRDAGIIASGQKVEHYEIASYGTLVAFAKTLGEDEAAALLEETLSEEKEADEILTQIAESSINIKAADDDEMAVESKNTKTVTATKSKRK